MKKIGITLLGLLALGALGIVSQAATSQWEDLGGGKARLLLSHNPDTNKITAAVEIELEEGWSTYWRYPGGAGIPPTFDFSATPGLNITETHFQAPELLGNDPAYAGYKKNAVFLMSGLLEADIKAPVTLDMVVGLCSTICVPAKARFEVPRNSLRASDGIASRVISFAKLKLPKHNNDIPKGMTKNLADEELQITIDDNPDWASPKLFVEGPKEWFLTPARLISRQDGKLVFGLYVGEASDLSSVLKEPLRYTLTTTGNSFEFTD